MLKKGIFSWYGYESDLSNRMESIASAGFDATCLWFGIEERSFRDDRMDEMIDLARDLALFIDNIHAPFDRCNYIWSENPNEREEIFHIFQKCINFCADNKIPNSVIHLSRGDNPPEFCESGLELLQELVDLAEREGVVLAIENCRKKEHFEYVLSNIESENLGFCYDSSHDALYGNPPVEIIEKWGQRLVTLHLSDNAGILDDHWLPGEGKIQWEPVLDLLKSSNYSGTIMLEVFPKNQDIETEIEFLKRAYTIASEFEGYIVNN